MDLNYDVLVGFSRLDITPPLGINLRGYFPMKDSYDIVVYAKVSKQWIG